MDAGMIGLTTLSENDINKNPSYTRIFKLEKFTPFNYHLYQGGCTGAAGSIDCCSVVANVADGSNLT
jgi:hypothetical protein